MGFEKIVRDESRKYVPIDDPLFCKMAEDRSFCEEILKVFLDDPELVVLKNQPQFTVKNLKGRSVVLDCYCKLCGGRLVNVEVQKENNDDSQRRMRYNSSVLTANVTKRRTKFRDLPDIYSIFVSRFDVFKKGLTTYHIDRVIRETGDVVDNGQREIYVNAAVNDGSRIAELMEVLTKENAYNDCFPRTSALKYRYRETEEGEKEMCEISERLVNYGKQAGKKEGLKEGQNIINMLNQFLISENRMDDLVRATKDKTYQACLIKEMQASKRR